MITSDPYAFATHAAEQIVKGLGIVTLPVDPKAIARGRGIDVVAKPMENEGVSGMLIRYGNEFAIAYATHHENEGFENFSVAHELGHYFLPGHAEAVIAGDTGSHASRAGYSSGDKYEAEAAGDDPAQFFRAGTAIRLRKMFRQWLSALAHTAAVDLSRPRGRVQAKNLTLPPKKTSQKKCRR